jgi:hypothetical protein
MKKLFIILLLCVLFQAHGQLRTLGFTLDEKKGRITLPFELYNNLIVIPVVLNGKIPLKFILDTGVRTAILTDRIITDILQLPYSRKITISGPGGQQLISAFITNNVSLTIPPSLSSTGSSLLVLEEDYLELKNHLGIEIHGVIGYEIFSRFIVKINYELKEITFSTEQNFRKPRSYQAFDLSVEDTKPYIFANCVFRRNQPLTLKLMADTGASHCLLLHPDTNSGILIPEKNVHGSIGRALGGDISGSTGRIQSISIGNYMLENPLANFPDPESYADTLRSTTTFRNGTIGGELLGRFNLIFNYAGGKIYLRKNYHYRKPFKYNLSGITIHATGPELNVFEVSEVRVGSAGFSAGIQSGDHLTRINHTATKVLKLTEINDILNSRRGKKIHLTLSRGENELKRTIVLHDDL